MSASMRPASPHTSSTHRADSADADHLADAARYAVLKRIAPKLRHDMAGAMQPIGMIAMVLQRRLQAPEPDLEAIAKNVAAMASLVKEATTGGMSAMGWLAPREEAVVGLRAGVDEVIKLLAMELSASGLTPVIDLPADATRVPREWVRSVITGALLACCDERGGPGTLHIAFEGNAQLGDQVGARLVLKQVTATAIAAAEPLVVVPLRPITWADVDAMTSSFGVGLLCADGRVALALPRSAD
jgi:hypothetical protein